MRRVSRGHGHRLVGTFFIRLAILLVMHPQSRSVVVLGSTGSIGRNTLEVVAAAEGRLRVVGLTAHGNLNLLCQQAVRFGVDWIVATDTERAAGFAWPELPGGIGVGVGREAMLARVVQDDVDIVVCAIVGSAGLAGTWAALEAGKDVALANKETLVMAGPLVMDLAARRGARILPVDSEHSAIFQALQAGQLRELKRVVLTASGGPFRDLPATELSKVTVEQALRHPTWNMGPKISVDSATMMNKALEVIEARWLFGLDPDQIEVVIHPQSIVHSLVEFHDGSLMAQLSPPDMKLPIQYALSYPERWPGPAEKMDWTQRWQLEFRPPDLERFPALQLGFEAARAGGTAGAVLNAANEAAVDRFLNRQIAFTQIVPACRSVLENHAFHSQPTLDQLIALDAWARQEVLRWMG